MHGLEQRMAQLPKDRKAGDGFTVEFLRDLCAFAVKTV
jgi:hypothetical protein